LIEVRMLKRMGGKYKELWEKQTQGHVAKTSAKTKGGEEEDDMVKPLIDLTPTGDDDEMMTSRSDN
jgi:hypothetical protein